MKLSLRAHKTRDTLQNVVHFNRRILFGLRVFCKFLSLIIRLFFLFFPAYILCYKINCKNIDCHFFIFLFFFQRKVRL